jgi:ribosomal 50S subunit-associated protein YjgA (DUF615 family)
MGKREVRRLAAFQGSHCSRLFRISLREIMTNEQELNDVGDERCFLKWIKQRRVQLIGHIVRHMNMYKKIIEGVVDGTKSAKNAQNGIYETVTEGRDMCIILNVEAKSIRQRCMGSC